MSQLFVDDVINKEGTGSVGFSKGINVTGVATAQGGIEFGAAGVGGTIRSSGDITLAGVITATTFSGAATGLTGVPGGQITGALAAVDGSALTGMANTANVNTAGLNVVGVATVGSGVTINSTGIEVTSGIITAGTCLKAGGGTWGPGIGATILGSGDSVFAGIVTATTFVPSAASGQLSNRNVIINGDAQVSQRGTSQASITSGAYYTVDRWYVTINTCGTWTMAQDTDVPSGYGYSKSISMDCTTADASLGAADRLMLSYRVEGADMQRFGKGTSNDKKFAVSFWVKSSKTGTYILELYDHDNSRHICKSYTVSSADTWEHKQLIIDNETSYPFGNDTGKSLELQFYLAAGSNYTSGTLATSWAAATSANRAVGQVNVADNTANEFLLTAVQLEVGNCTPFEILSYDQQEGRCFRYLQRWSFSADKMGVAILPQSSADTSYGAWDYYKPLRSSGSDITFSYSGASDFDMINTGDFDYAISSITNSAARRGKYKSEFVVSWSSRGASNECCTLRSNGANGWIQFDCEI